MRCVRFALLWMLLASFARAAGPVSPVEFTAAYAAITAAKGQTNDAARLHQLFDLDWRYQMIESPETATYVGYAGQNARWGDSSRAAIERRKAELTRPLRVLESIDRTGLNDTDQLAYDLFRRLVQRAIDGQRFPEELMPINQMGGIQQGVAETLSLMPATKRSQFEDMIARLNGVGVLTDQTLALLREGLAKGITPPKITLRDVPQQVLNQLPADPHQSALYRPFREMPRDFSEAEKEEIRGRALAAITNVVYPKFRELHRFLAEEYVPQARESIACSALPDGAAWYAFRARNYTTTELTPAQIHELGLSEVKRIRAEMERIKGDTGFKGSLPEFFTSLRTNKEFFFDRPAELLAGYRDIAKRIDGQLPKVFGKLPRLPYGVSPVPSYAERSQTTAYYQPGASSFGRPGVFFANTYALNTRPKWEMEALTLHESVPGHHLQIAIAQELEGVPEFQKHAETTAFVEGWGLYSESLGEELGLFQDPYSKFGQLTYEMWRAIRLVVDTGMHSLGWTRQQAIDFFLANAGKSEHDITVEVDRYIVWPGQALAYKIGELKLKELRAYAAKELGDRFDVRSFHDEILGHGALPLDVLEPRIKAWVARQKTEPAR
jgi:uncharacterized protein (DUF885 family)